MTITTRFNRGDQVVNAKTGKVFRVGEIQIKVWEYEGRQVLNIQYREVKPSTDPEFPNLTISGVWVHEGNVRQ